MSRKRARVYSPAARRYGVRRERPGRFTRFGRWVKGLFRRSYDAADRGRRSGVWPFSGAGPNAEVDRGAVDVRNNVRDLVRNDALAASMVAVLTNNAIGDGIKPEAAFPDPLGELRLPASRWDPAETLAERCDRVWDEAVETAEASGQLSLYGQQGVAFRGMVESNESLLLRDWDVDDSMLPVRISAVEGDLLDRTMTKRLDLGEEEFGYVVQGVQFDRRGRRVSYWLHPEHPGETTLRAWDADNALMSWSQSAPWPAADVSHVYREQRPGQVRGISMIAPSAPNMRLLRDHADAELERIRMEACVFASVYGAGDGYATGGTDDLAPVTDVDGVVIERLQPGSVWYPPDGTEIKHHVPSSTGGHEAFRQQQLMLAAAGVELSYVLATKDLRGVSFSGLRHDLNEFHRSIRALREAVVLRNICRPQWVWVMQAAQLAGRLPLGITRWPARWTPPRWESVDRLKDATADFWELAAGTADLGSLLREKGRSLTDVLRGQSKAIQVARDQDPEVPLAWTKFRPWNETEAERVEALEAEQAETLETDT